MGSIDFFTYQAGTNVEEAFDSAIADAVHEYGHRPHTGTIAEKDSYTVITNTPMTAKEAEQYAGHLLRADDSRIADERGPAGAVPVMTDERTVKVTITTADAPSGGFNGSVEEIARAVLTSRGELAEGEDVAYGVTGRYESHPVTGRPYTGTLSVPLKGGTLRHTGWLFFGYASF
ncbi:hypothetical protein [Streptomyces diastaticus]|uniref:hypothetical protein n=1 Tax=Streptomyces diastaticus TaxID=1956 RepID=UPI00366987C9